MSDPPRVRSAVYSALRRLEAEAAEQQVMPLDELKHLGVKVKEV